MQGETVTVIAVVTTTDDHGDSSTTQTQQDVAGALFEPMQAVERTDSRSPGVVSPAKFYLPVPLELDSDDVIVRSGVAWQVVGGSSVWGDQTEVPVKRAASV